MSKPTRAELRKLRAEVALLVTIGALYAYGLPAAFIAVEVIAAQVVGGWLGACLWVIAGWNVVVIGYRIMVGLGDSE